MRGVYAGIWIGIRYLGSSERQLSAATMLSVAGLALGISVLVLVMSVMNGLQSELRQRLLSAIPHIEFLDDRLATQPVAPELLADSQVAGAGRFLRFEAVIRGAGPAGGQVVSVWAVESELEPQISSVPDSLVAGRWPSKNERALVLGRALAGRLGLVVGDKLTLLFLDQPADSRVPRPQHLTLVLSGLFDLSAELNYSLAFIDVDAALQVLPASAYRGGWRFRLTDPLWAPVKAEQLMPSEVVSVRTWADTFGSLFRAVRLEKAIMFTLLLLIIVLASLSVTSTQMLAADQKRSAIAILRTLGMSQSSIALVFLVQAFVVSGLGIAIGGLAGVSLALHIGDIMIWVEEATGFSLLKDTYFDRLPAVWRGSDLAVIFSLAFLLTLISTLYPALRAAGARPAVALAMPN